MVEVDILVLFCFFLFPTEIKHSQILIIDINSPSDCEFQGKLLAACTNRTMRPQMVMFTNTTRYPR
jgi:hypothetical protein